jgi:hypothetical protein
VVGTGWRWISWFTSILFAVALLTCSPFPKPICRDHWAEGVGSGKTDTCPWRLERTSICLLLRIRVCDCPGDHFLLVCYISYDAFDDLFFRAPGRAVIPATFNDLAGLVRGFVDRLTYQKQDLAEMAFTRNLALGLAVPRMVALLCQSLYFGLHER